MLRDISELIREGFRKVLGSRLFFLGVVFLLMGARLVSELFELQIRKGEAYLNDYVQKTERTITTPGTRGRIYDRNGKVLAYNELAYTVTIQDTGHYRTRADMNAMLLRLVGVLEKHGYSVQGRFEVAINSNGEMVYTSSSPAARLRFLRDFYGLSSVDKLDQDGKYPSNITAREAFEQRKKSYELDKMKDELGNPALLPDETVLQIINIRYTMSMSSFRRYMATPITSYVDKETVAEILERSAQLQGVDVEQSTIRKYNESIYLAPIIGYTGKILEDQLEELKKANDDYEPNDVVGRIGIEASMEAELRGKKGYRDIIVDNLGNIMQTTEEVLPAAGNDIYLTIDMDLQIGIYHLLEQQLAGILVDKLVPETAVVDKNVDSTNMMIPIRKAYYQLINNNVLSLKAMEAETASEIEKEIFNRFASARAQILANMRAELKSAHATRMKDLTPDMMDYMAYVYTYLAEEIGVINKDMIDKNSEAYQLWGRNEMSLRDYLYYGIAQNWIDTTKLEVPSKYSNADDIYDILVEYVLTKLEGHVKFTKLVCGYLVDGGVITGRQLCLALYAQGALPADEEEIHKLMAGGEDYAYAFMLDKISNIEITPAQLALDPCTAGCVITDVNTGEVRALVTYPSYDNNRLSGTVDAAYFSQLQEDLSLPLYNNATQAKKAPGSTFKPITAIAGLEEGAITLTEAIDCTGIYDLVAQPIRCWIYPGHHGPLNVSQGIQNSCNYFVSEIAHRLSTDEDGNYSAARGIETLSKYAAMFGLDHPSGIEISENDPAITKDDPERSSMGQGTNSYTNVQLARYTAALANQGTVFELSLIDKVMNAKGELLKDYTPKIHSQIEIKDSTWDAVRQGMRGVVAEGSAAKIFKDLEVEIAGKTGTAQESRTRANHAFFISYGPYQNPDISVTVNIPNGYSSSNAATVAKDIYRFYYGYTDLDYIKNTGALDVSDVKIGD